MNKTYLCGKIGKSVKFNSKNWNAIGGDMDAPTLILKLAELNPTDNFIIIGKNDLSTSKKIINIPKNIYDIYEFSSIEEKKSINFIYEKLKNIKIDGCFLFAGPTANCNIPNKSFKRNELNNGNKIFAKILETFRNYVAPIYFYLNETKIPWIMIANDPRYIKQGYDLFNQPIKIISQYDEIISMKRLNNFEEQKYIQNDIKSEYSGIEKLFLFDKKIIKYKKNKKFIIVLNEGNNGVRSRYDELKKYVLNYITDVEIYGQWDENTIRNDTRFKGPKKFIDLQNELNNVKYTFIISIKPGWVTAKYAEMIVNGIIPFFHPDYDNQKHIKIPDFLRVKSPEDLHNKIEILENNEELYLKILSDCISIFDELDFSGEKISNMILKSIPNANIGGLEYTEYLKQKIKGNINEW